MTTLRVPLVRLAHARSGDKADWVDFGLFAWNAAGYRILEREVTAGRVRAHFEAWLPGESINLVQVHYDNPRYSLPQPLPAGQTWQDCLPLPALRRGYRAASLEYRATNLHGVFHNQ